MKFQQWPPLSIGNSNNDLPIHVMDGKIVCDMKGHISINP